MSVNAGSSFGMSYRTRSYRFLGEVSLTLLFRNLTVSDRIQTLGRYFSDYNTFFTVRYARKRHDTVRLALFWLNGRITVNFLIKNIDIKIEVGRLLLPRYNGDHPF
jgi:hypothetical protein